MSLPDPHVPLRYPELLHRALEGELLEHERQAWALLEAQPETGSAMTELQGVAQSLRLLERIHAPPGFSSVLSKRIAVDAGAPQVAAELAVVGLPRVQAPDGFAARLAAMVAAEADERIPEEVLEAGAVVHRVRALERIEAPAGFASRLAAQIAAEAGHLPVVGSVVRDAERGPTPLYFLGATLVAALLGALTLGWGEARTVGLAVAEGLRTLTPGLLVTVVAVVAVFALTATNRLRLNPASSFAAFALAVLLAAPQVLPLVGSTRVADATQTVVRFGDLSVGGTIRGDAISVGGTLTLEPGARVTGRAVALLGDVSVQLEAQASEGLSAVAGVVRAGDVPTVVLKENWPGLSAANALKPLRQFLAESDWRVLYFALVAAVAVMLALLSDRLDGLERVFKAESGRTLGSGLLLALGAAGLALAFGLSGMLTTLGLLIASVLVVSLTVGFAVSLLEFGRGVRHALRRWLPRNLTPRGSNTLEVGIGLVGFALTLIWLPLAVALWLLGAAWGLGAVALEWRSGRLAQELFHQGTH